MRKLWRYAAAACVVVFLTTLLIDPGTQVNAVNMDCKCDEIVSDCDKDLDPCGCVDWDDCSSKIYYYDFTGTNPTTCYMYDSGETQQYEYYCTEKVLALCSKCYACHTVDATPDTRCPTEDDPWDFCVNGEEDGATCYDCNATGVPGNFYVMSSSCEYYC